MRVATARKLCVVWLLSVATATGQAAPQNSTTSSGTARQNESSQSAYLLKVKSRLVTVDVVAMDSHGNPVTDLKPEEFRLVAGREGEQKIADFEFIGKPTDSSVKAASPEGTGPEQTISNQAMFQGLQVPPTVFLLDALNTTPQNQIEARRHMLSLLTKLPASTPVALFLLTNRLRMVQTFTTDPAVLRAVLKKLANANMIDTDSRDDPNGVANTIEQSIQDAGSQDDDGETELADFEREQFASTVDLRVRQTVNALSSIARSLGGIPGRKNLIWMSEFFPTSIYPDTDFARDAFEGTRNYASQVEAAANALTDAQVAVYPVDAGGLATTQAFTASQGPIVSRNGMVGPPATQLNHEQDARFQSQQTMNSVAENTGGRSCKNTNDLSGCVNTALRDSSSYYQLDFYPQDTKWDGAFHRITIKTTRSGVRLSYRRGYFAVDGEQLAKQEAPDDRLREACSDFLPSTAIHLTAQAVSQSAQDGMKYTVSIAPDALTLIPQGATQAIALQAALCRFNGKGDNFQFSKQDLSGELSESVLRAWQTQGLPDSVTIQPDASTRAVRFVVLDVPTGLTGALDLPVSRGSGGATAGVTPIPAIVIKKSVLEIPDRPAPQTPQQPMGSMSFHGASGSSGTLDWDGDTLRYLGDLPVEQSAPAFFNYAFGGKFRCEGGALAPIDPATGEAKLVITVRNGEGRFATVELDGSEPKYSGDLVIDAKARVFFNLVWQLSHCR